MVGVIRAVNHAGCIDTRRWGSLHTEPMIQNKIDVGNSIETSYEYDQYGQTTGSTSIRCLQCGITARADQEPLDHAAGCPMDATVGIESEYPFTILAEDDR